VVEVAGGVGGLAHRDGLAIRGHPGTPPGGGVEICRLQNGWAESVCVCVCVGAWVRGGVHAYPLPPPPAAKSSSTNGGSYPWGGRRYIRRTIRRVQGERPNHGRLTSGGGCKCGEPLPYWLRLNIGIPHVLRNGYRWDPIPHDG